VHTSIRYTTMSEQMDVTTLHVETGKRKCTLSIGKSIRRPVNWLEGISHSSLMHTWRVQIYSLVYTLSPWQE